MAERMLNEAVKRLGELGFTMDEVMQGEHEFEPGCGAPGRQRMEFRVKWGPKSIAKWLRPGDESFMRHELRGAVTVGGLCERAACEGTLELRYLDEHKIRYAFDFTANGKRYHYVGEKVNIRPWNLPFSHTTCFGRITESDSGKLVSTSVTYFKLGTMLDFLISFRLT